VALTDGQALGEWTGTGNTTRRGENTGRSKLDSSLWSRDLST
jgi:hypothetical protein